MSGDGNADDAGVEDQGGLIVKKSVAEIPIILFEGIVISDTRGGKVSITIKQIFNGVCSDIATIFCGIAAD